MITAKIAKGKQARIGVPAYWRDKHGVARVMVVADGYAMMRRKGSIPFVVRCKDLLNGAAGWQRDNGDL